MQVVTTGIVVQLARPVPIPDVGQGITLVVLNQSQHHMADLQPTGDVCLQHLEISQRLQRSFIYQDS